MITLTTTEIFLDNPPIVGGYYVSVAWRYGISGSWTGLVPSVFVQNDGTLVSPIVLEYDETINPTVQLRFTYIDCASSVPYIVSYTAGEGTSTSSTTSTTTIPGSTTTTTTTTPMKAYWGWKNTNEVLNEIQIESSPNSVDIGIVSDVIADYRPNIIPQYLWMAENKDVVVKNAWFGTALNNGDIGGPSDLFVAPIIVGNYRFYITAYQTQQNDTTIKFFNDTI